MKKILYLIILMLLSLSSVVFAQDDYHEKAKPLVNETIVRKVRVMKIEGTTYENVIVTIKSTGPDLILTDCYNVNVLIQDIKKKKIYKKNFKDSFLYVFRGGQIQVGRVNFNKMVLYEPVDGWSTFGILNEKEGVF